MRAIIGDSPPVHEACGLPEIILDIQGLQSDWPLLPLDLTVANSAPGRYSRY
jgi:hypothetical protein